MAQHHVIVTKERIDNSATWQQWRSSDVDIERSLRTSATGTTRHASAKNVPVIDMSQPDAADAMWAAATTVGFFTVTNHGVPDELIENAFASSKQFFARDLDAKQRERRAATQQRLRVLFASKAVDGHGRSEGESADHGARGRHGRPLAPRAGSLATRRAGHDGGVKNARGAHFGHARAARLSEP